MTEIFDIFEKIRNEWDFFFAKEENSDFYLNSIKEIMQRKANFELTYYRDHYLKGRLYHRIRAKNFGSFKEYSILLENSNREVQILKDLLTIHTTEFFRDEKPFRYLERVLLPKIIRMKSNSSIPICNSFGPMFYWSRSIFYRNNCSLFKIKRTNSKPGSNYWCGYRSG